MTSNINHEAGTDEIADALRVAAERLGEIDQRNNALGDQFENQGWSGLDSLRTAGDRISTAGDSLTTVAEKVGYGGALVRDAYQANSMVGEKASVTEIGRK